MSSPRRRWIRWSIPVAVVASSIGVASLSHLGTAGAKVPNLPPLTAAELLAKATSAKVPAFSGTVQLTANLGLPNISAFTGSVPGSLTDLITGVHRAHVSASGPDKIRVSLDAPLAESDWVRNGDDVWAWDSSKQTVTHAKTTPAADSLLPGVAPTTETAEPAMDPTAMAKSALAMVDPTTVVSVRNSAYVAGHAAYELVLAPKSATSTVGEIVIAIDAATGTPLDAKVIAKGATSPALELGFSSITFAEPAPSTFQFSPPPGAKLVEAQNVGDLIPMFGTGEHHRHQQDSIGQPTTKTVGTAWDSVVVMSGVPVDERISSLLGSAAAITLPGGVTAKVVHTALFNVLIASDGRLGVGAVTPAVLQAALAQ